MAGLDPCPCGNPRTLTNGLVQCAHCDLPCLIRPNVCRWCQAYGTAVNLRVIQEHHHERYGGTSE